jgi:predicted SAM-dependent methyltransferase
VQAIRQIPTFPKIDPVEERLLTMLGVKWHDAQQVSVLEAMGLSLPFKDNEFDEIHAYQVLEHLGQQGDYKLFFAQFSEFWRLLKPNGHFLATCPSRTSVWAYGDPSHTRIMQLEQLVFLSQDEYKRQVGRTPMSDFRNIYKADFKTVFQEEDDDIRFVLKAIKN